MKWADIRSEVPHLLEKIHKDMFEKARQIRDDHYKEADNWKDFMDALNDRNIVLTPWCNE